MSVFTGMTWRAGLAAYLRVKVLTVAALAMPAVSCGCAHGYAGEEESVGPADPVTTAGPKKAPQGDQPKKYAEPPVVETTYDEFKDLTTTETVVPLVPRYSSDRRPQAVTLVSVSRGRKALQGAVVAIKITDRSSDWQHIRNPELILIVDGQRMIFRKMIHRGDVGRDQVGMFVTENVYATIGREDLLLLVAARSVRGQLDVSRFDVPPDQLHRFAGFARAIGIEPASVAAEPTPTEDSK